MSVFFVISSNLLMFDYIFFSAKTPIYPGSSLTSLEQTVRAEKLILQATVLVRFPNKT